MKKVIRKVIGNETYFAAINAGHDFFPNMMNTNIAVINGERFVGTENISLMRGLSHFYKGVREIVAEKYPNVDMDVSDNIVKYANKMVDEAERLNNQVEDFVCSVYKAVVTGVTAGKKYISVYGIDEENVLDVRVILNSPYSSTPYITVSHDETITHYTIDTVGSRTIDGLRVGKKVELEELRYIKPHEQMLINEVVSVKVFPSRLDWLTPKNVDPTGTIDAAADNIMSCVNNFENLFKHSMYDIPGVEPMHLHGSAYRPLHFGHRNKNGYGGVVTNRSTVNFAHIQSSLASEFGRTLINKGISVGAITSSLGDNDLLFLGDVIFDEEFYGPDENHTGYAWMTINNITRVLKLHYAKPGMLYPATTTLEYMYGSEMSELVGTKLEVQVGEGAVKIYDTFTGQNIGHYDLVNWNIFTTVDNHKALEREGYIKKYTFGMPEMNDVLLDLKIDPDVYTEIFQATTGYTRGKMDNISDHDMATAKAIGIRYGKDVHFLVNVIDRLIYVKYMAQENTVSLKVTNSNYFDDAFFVRVTNFEPNFNKGLHLSMKHSSYPDGKNVELSEATKYYIEPSNGEVFESMDEFKTDVENILGIDKDTINVSIENIPSSVVPDMKLTLFIHDRVLYGWNNQTRTICKLPNFMGRGFGLVNDITFFDFKKNLVNASFANHNGAVVINIIYKDNISVTITGFEGFNTEARIEKAKECIGDAYSLTNNNIHPLWDKLKGNNNITKDMIIIGTNIPVSDHGIVIDAEVIHAMVGVDAKTKLPHILIVNTLNNTIEVYQEIITTTLNILDRGTPETITVEYNGKNIRYIDHADRVDTEIDDPALLKVKYPKPSFKMIFDGDSYLSVIAILSSNEEKESNEDNLKDILIATGDAVDTQEFIASTYYPGFKIITNGIKVTNTFSAQPVYPKSMLIEDNEGNYLFALEGGLDYGICTIGKNELNFAIKLLKVIDGKVIPEIVISRKDMGSELTYSLVLKNSNGDLIQHGLCYQNSIDKESSDFEETYVENNSFIREAITANKCVLEENMFVPFLTNIKDAGLLPTLLTGNKLISMGVNGQGSVGKQVITTINEQGEVVFIISNTEKDQVLYGTISDRLSSANNAVCIMPDYDVFIVMPYADDGYKLLMMTKDKESSIEFTLDLKPLVMPNVQTQDLEPTEFTHGNYKAYENELKELIDVDDINQHFPFVNKLEDFKNFLKSKGVDTIYGMYIMGDTVIYSSTAPTIGNSAMELNLFIVIGDDEDKVKALNFGSFTVTSLHYNNIKSLTIDKILVEGTDVKYGVNTDNQDVFELVNTHFVRNVKFTDDTIKSNDELLEEASTTSFTYTIEEFFEKFTVWLPTSVVKELTREIIKDDRVNNPLLAVKDKNVTIIICSTLKGAAPYVMFKYDVSTGVLNKHYLDYNNIVTANPDVIKIIDYDFTTGYFRIGGTLNGRGHEQILKIRGCGDEAIPAKRSAIQFRSSLQDSSHIREEAVNYINENKLVADADYILEIDVDGRYRNTEHAILVKTAREYRLLVVHKHKVTIHKIHNNKMLERILDQDGTFKYKGTAHLSCVNDEGTGGLRMTEINK